MAPIVIFDLQNWNYDQPANDQREIELLPNERVDDLALILLAEDLAGFCIAHSFNAEDGWWEREDQCRYGVTWQPDEIFVTVFAGAGDMHPLSNKAQIVKYTQEIIDSVDRADLDKQQLIDLEEAVMKIRKRLAQEDGETADAY